MGRLATPRRNAQEFGPRACRASRRMPLRRYASCGCLNRTPNADPAAENGPGDAPGRGHGLGHELTSNRVCGSLRRPKSKALKHAAVGCFVRHASLYGTDGRGIESLLVLPVSALGEPMRPPGRTSPTPRGDGPRIPGPKKRRHRPSPGPRPRVAPSPCRPIVRPARHASRALRVPTGSNAAKLGGWAADQALRGGVAVAARRGGWRAELL